MRTVDGGGQTAASLSEVACVSRIERLLYLGCLLLGMAVSSGETYLMQSSNVFVFGATRPAWCCLKHGGLPVTGAPASSETEVPAP